MNRLVLCGAIALVMLAFMSTSSATFANTLPGDKPIAVPELAATMHFGPEADAHVTEDSPRTNYGTAVRLRVDSSPVAKSYLRFNVQGLSGTVTNATLRIYALDSLSAGYKVRGVGDDSWGETSINYRNAPSAGSTAYSSGPVTAGTWSSVDITPMITGNSVYSVVLTASSSTVLKLASRESATAPQLVITTNAATTPVAPTATPVPPTATRTAAPPTATLAAPTATSAAPTSTPGSSSGSVTVNPVADAHVNAGYPSTNYGAASQLRVDASPVKRGYLRFGVSGLTAGVTRATLRLYAESSQSAGYTVRRVADNSWSESAITYNNAPALGTIIGTSGAVNAGTWTTVDVTSYVAGNGTYSFALTSGEAAVLGLASRESTNKPQLVITTGSSTLPTPTWTATSVAPTATRVPPTGTPTRTATSMPATATPTRVPPTPTLAPSGQVLWTANMETGNLSQWYVNSGGGEYNSGQASSSASRDVARTGSWSAKLTITTPSSPTSGVRLFRWAESRTHPALYYSAWFYFPRRYDAPNWWNIWQWKTKTASANDPYYLLDVGNRSDGSMYIYLYNWVDRRSYNQSLKNLPVGQWTHIEGYYRCASDTSGRVTIWQDGVKLFDVANTRTRYSGGDCQWSANNYSDSLSPSPATIYLDDAAISTGWIP